jgi:hypothetical protein
MLSNYICGLHVNVRSKPSALEHTVTVVNCRLFCKKKKKTVYPRKINVGERRNPMWPKIRYMWGRCNRGSYNDKAQGNGLGMIKTSVIAEVRYNRGRYNRGPLYCVSVFNILTQTAEAHSVKILIKKCPTNITELRRATWILTYSRSIIKGVYLGDRGIKCGQEEVASVVMSLNKHTPRMAIPCHGAFPPFFSYEGNGQKTD